MFYSQFILAKKGPLGTIWIAAHLERKLRKNQVADTDIGVSVDSILSPEVPIALRLSSHLLLGVVRIYNRKVNYLFDDCSEALLKVKQAFRSTAVDLPPEESKAPYHSITLPEKFDLDDFELPDSDIFQGNYVDHHISSREQITLQDTVEGVSYSTSKFGLDERFGDGDASGLDLDEELFFDKLGNTRHVDESSDPQASFKSMSPLKQDECPEDRAANSEAMVDVVDEYGDPTDYAQGPRTPRLVEEPNLSNVQDASACDDHLESEYNLMESTIKKNTSVVPFEDKQDMDWCSGEDIISDAVPQGPPKENENQSGGVEINELKPHGESPIEKESSLVFESSTHLLGQLEAIKPTSELTEKIINSSDVPHQGDAPTEYLTKEKPSFLSVDETCDNHQVPGGIGLEKGADEIAGDRSELAMDNQGSSFQGTHETQSCQETKNSSALNLDASDKEADGETLVLRPCNSTLEYPDVAIVGGMPTDANLESDSNALVTTRKEEIAELGKYCISGNSEQELNANQVRGQAFGEDIQVEGEADGLIDDSNSQDKLANNSNTAPESELPAPEKLLSVPKDHMNLSSGMLVEVRPEDFEGPQQGDAGSKTAAGRKRSFTESTLTEQSLNSVESSRHVRVKRTTGSIPDDDDLLSSILVGRASSVLKVKPTPPLYEVTSVKRTRSAPRSGPPKRKLLMDDTMVLHGDAIRQQLTNTEDIRRVRKKAPCTLPEISMIEKQYMQDEIFLKAIFTGMSVQLTYLHSQAYNLNQITVRKNDDSLGTVSEPRLAPQNNENGVSLETMVGPSLDSQNDICGASYETVDRLHSTSQNDGNHEMKYDKGPGETDIMEESIQGVTNELLIVRDNEIAEPRENHLLNEMRLEDVDNTSPGVNVNQEQTKPTNDMRPDESQQELSPDAAGVAANPFLISEVEPVDSTGYGTGDIHDASVGMFQTASLNEVDETFYYGNTDAAGVPQKIDIPSVELDYADVDDAQANVSNEVAEKDPDAEGETELRARDDILPGVTQDAATVELIDSDNHGEFNVQSDIHNNTYEEQREGGFSYPELANVLDDGSMNNCVDPSHQESYQPNMTDAEISGFDLHDQDELNYLAAGNDTEFLNVDDDELSGTADDYMPDAEETRYTENSGWSSRTRAVSKYLQTAFVKEAECGNKSLSMDHLLTGKSRKEASRMFFETLVLKTRDYIHVEQRNPFDDIAIKPRTRLMKSDF